MGHQELSGSFPSGPEPEAFFTKADTVAGHLISGGHTVTKVEKDGLVYLIADDSVVIGDTLDADFGIAYSCVAPLSEIDFAKELKIGRLVREVVNVGRVIVVGGAGTKEQLFSAVSTRDDSMIGVNNVLAGCYDGEYKSVNMGCTINCTVQTPCLLHRRGIPVTMIGKQQIL